MFVAVAWLCGSACNIYHGDSLKTKQQSAPATAAPEPRNSRNFELIGIRSPPPTIELRLNNSAEPPENQKAAAPPVAGTRAPGEKQPPDMDRQRREEMENANAEDAGVAFERSAPPPPTALVDAGARDPEASRPQKIETGRPREADAGKSHFVAKVSAACRGELGYETDGRCYFVLDAPVSWNVGRDHCYEHDAHLASVTSERESDLIVDFELEHDVWIGFSRFGAANFSWLTNESGSFSNWQKGAPRAMQESGALVAAGTGLWTNRAVSELHAALCETERRSP